MRRDPGTVGHPKAQVVDAILIQVGRHGAFPHTDEAEIEGMVRDAVPSAPAAVGQIDHEAVVGPSRQIVETIAVKIADHGITCQQAGQLLIGAEIVIRVEIPRLSVKDGHFIAVGIVGIEAPCHRHAVDLLRLLAIDVGDSIVVRID